jgi:flagellin-like hook-associated protein FlgL
MTDIVLGVATQQNLLALQNINTNLETTQGHLATGLKVSSAVDDAVKYFQSQSLLDRASDLSTRKDAIDQGISTVTAATNGIQSAISILQQMQGILNAAKTESASQRAAAASQFNTLAEQMNALLNDTSYQGLNLVNSSKSNLSLQFSQLSASQLKIQGQNVLVSALFSQVSLPWTGAISVGSGHSAGSGNSAFALQAYKASRAATALTGIKFSLAVSQDKVSVFDIAFSALQNAVSKAQAAAQTLGSNVSFLQTRLAYTQQYIVTLQGGSSKLTVADVNVESTNLVTLQTRQQLAIQSLSIATASEQAVLRLFH